MQIFQVTSDSLLWFDLNKACNYKVTENETNPHFCTREFKEEGVVEGGGEGGFRPSSTK